MHSDVSLQWDMVCDKAGLASTVAAVFMIGRIIGCIFAGQLADRCACVCVRACVGVLAKVEGCWP